MDDMQKLKFNAHGTQLTCTLQQPAPIGVINVQLPSANIRVPSVVVDLIVAIDVPLTMAYHVIRLVLLVMVVPLTTRGQ
jgi:hypothetical protein